MPKHPRYLSRLRAYARGGAGGGWRNWSPPPQIRWLNPIDVIVGGLTMVVARWSCVQGRISLILGLVVTVAVFGFAAAEQADAKPRIIRAVAQEGSSMNAFNPAVVACDTTRPGTRFRITVSVVNRGRVIARASRVRVSGPKRCAAFGSATIRLPRDRTMRDRAVARATNLRTGKSASRVLIFPGHG